MPASKNDKELEALLSSLKNARGFDLTVYKEPSLVRRIKKRMEEVHVKTYADYVDYLERHPTEFAALFDSILINVTGFFRDPLAWDCLDKEVIPRILGHKHKDEGVRAWCAGCASGEEAYTLAIVLAEALGLDALNHRVRIFATDIDDAALTQARRGSYEANDLGDVPAALRNKYFEPVGDRFQVRNELRRPVIFGVHSLVSDAPISHVDLLVCRNTLMYFTSEAQARIMSRFAFALNPAGCLFVGKAEMLLSHSDTFSPVSTKHRIFLKAPYAQVFTARPAKTQSRSETANTAQVRQKSGHAAAARKFAPIAIEPHPVAHLVVDRDGVLMQINEHARTLFGLALHHVGHPIHKLDIARRPVELEELIKGVYAKGRSVRLKNVPHTGLSGEAQSFDVELVPLLAKQGKQIGVSVFFHEVTKIAALKREHMRAVEELETVNEELQATNEVLQSTNEELETTNEELQSANEELETMNEELQSSNEELRSLNELLQTHTQSANTSNAFLKAVLGSLNAGVAVVDRDFTVRAWNQKAEDLWGLRSEETCGQHLLSLDIGLPVERLKDTVRASLAGESTGQGIELDAVNRRGKSIRCRVTCTPLMNDGKEVQGAIAFMEELSA